MADDWDQFPVAGGASQKADTSSWDEFPAVGGSGGGETPGLVKSGAASAYKALTGGVGDLVQTGKNVANWAADKVGLPESVKSAGKTVLGATHLGRSLMNAPTSKQTSKAAEEVTGTPLPKPVTEGEKATSDIVGAVANPASYVGPGGPLVKLIGAGLSGAGSHYGKEADEALGGSGVTGSVLGGGAGGLLTGVGAKASSTISNMRRSKNIPTGDELIQSSNAGYQTGRQMGVHYEPSNVSTLSDGLKQELMQRGFRPRKAEGAFGIVDELKTAGDSGVPSDFSELESMRQALNDTAQETHDFTGKPTSDAKAARIAINHLDKFFQEPSNALPQHQQNAATLARMIEDARGDWSAGMSSKEIERSISNAEFRTGTSGSGSNIENVTRQELEKIRKNPARFNKYSADEKEGIEALIRGDTPRNAARLMGKLVSSGIVSTTGAAALSHLLGFGLAGHLGTQAGALIAKKSGEAMTRARINKLLDSVRADSPLGRQRGVPPWQKSLGLSPYVLRGAVANLNPYQVP